MAAMKRFLPLGASILVASLSTLVLSCAGRAASTSTGAVAIRFVDLYKPEMLHGRAQTAAAVAKKTVWRFDDTPSSPAKAFPETRGWEAGLGASGLTIRDGRLVGRSSSPYPVVTIERTEDLDNRDQFYGVEIRMKVSAGGNVSVSTRGPGPVPWPDIERTLNRGPWPISIPLTPGGDVQTYTLTSAAPLNATRIRRLLIRPTDIAGATFEIESVRLVFRREYLASVPSGVTWQGLGEIYRESLVSRAPETMTFSVTVPDRGWLDLGVGTIDEAPTTFRVSLKSDDSGSDRVLRQTTLTTPYRWEPMPVDLAAFAGRKVDLTLAVAGDAGAVGMWGSPAIRSRDLASASSGDSKPQGVIWIHADTLRPDHLSMYEAKRDTTPNLRRLASEGTLFTNAQSQATWTKVSTPSFLTSLYPTTHGVARQSDRLPASVTTVADVYRAAGYATLSLSSVVFSGQFTNLHKGFEQVHEATSQSDPVYTSKSAREYVDRVSDFIDGHKDGPFFIYLHVFDPHPPYEPRHPYEAMWADPAKRDEHLKQRDALRKTIKSPGMAPRGMATTDEMKAAGVDPATYLAYDEDWYDGSIRGLDAEIERLFERLRADGLDDRTAVVFMSDHGEEFQDHGRMWHGQSAYGELAHVPLMFRWPGHVPSGRRVDELVESIDIMPTMLDVSGLTHPRAIQGQSLVPLLGMIGKSAADWKRRPAITEKQPMREAADTPDPNHENEESWQSFAINDGEWKLIHHTIRPAERPEYELFDARRDPLDQHDVAGEHPDVVQRLSKALDGWHQMALASRVKPDAETTQKMSPEQLQKLRSLGYVK
jgi:arylsulfatase A-like enzyme